MRAYEIIRSILNFLDGNQEQSEPQVVLKPDPAITAGDDINRFKQIVDLADDPERHSFVNEPNPAYAGIDSVTIHAGGGINGPKHPADIRVKDPSATPHLIDQPFDQPSLEEPDHIIMIKKLGGL